MKKLILVVMIVFFIAVYFLPLSGSAIDFNTKDIKGNSVVLSKFKGKVVILDFWATWCPPCRKEIPNLKKIYSEFKGDNFEIISIALERRPSEYAKKFIKENGMNWIHIVDKEEGRRIAKDYKIRYIPTMYVINKRGDIVESGIRGEKLKERIIELLK